MTTDPRPTPFGEEHNNLLAAGGIFGLLLPHADLDSIKIYDDGAATITVTLPFLRSSYRLTVERIVDDPAAPR